MRSGYRVVSRSAIVAAASLVIRADVTPPSQASEVQLQLGDILFSEGRFLDSLDAYRNALKVAPPDSVRRPRMGVIASALARGGVRPGARTKPKSCFESDPTSPGSDDALRRRALVVGPVPGSRAEVQGRAGGVAGSGARPSRDGEGARGAQPARRRDERGAGGAAAVAARSGNPPHRRARSTSGSTSTRKRPAPTRTTSTCCRTRTTARRPTGRAPKSASCARSASACRSRPIPAPTTRLYTVDFRLVNDKVVVRAKVNDAVGAGLRRRHRIGEHRHHASDGAAARHHAGHLHAERRRRPGRPARAAAGAHRFARARIAQAAQRAVPDQEPAAARHPGEGNRGAVAARARLLDGHRLQDAQADLRQAPARGAEGLRAAAAPASPGHGARHGRRQPPGELRRRHRRGSDLDQPGDGDVAAASPRPAAGSR